MSNPAAWLVKWKGGGSAYFTEDEANHAAKNINTYADYRPAEVVPVYYAEQSCSQDGQADVRQDGLRPALQQIASQKTCDELAAEGDGLDEDADFVGAYDALITIARRALASQAGQAGQADVRQWRGPAMERQMDLHAKDIAAQAPSETSSGVEPAAWQDALKAEIEKWETDLRYHYPDHEVLESLDRIRDASPPPSASQASCTPPESIKARLDSIAPAVENLACHQEQCDMDGVMVKVSRQAVDEVVNAINEIAISIAAFPREESRDQANEAMDYEDHRYNRGPA